MHPISVSGHAYMNVLIIEDEAKVANNLKLSLEEYGYSASVAFDSTMGIKLLNQKHFDILVSDVILPGKNGFDLCKEVRNSHPNIKIIMLTALGSIEDKVEGLEAGADDYLVKPFDLRELIARIKAVAKRGTVHDHQDLLKIGDLEINPLSKTARRSGTTIDLTSKEYHLLHFLLKNKGKVMSRAVITEQVWDLDFDPGTNVVDVYINILRKKIDKNYERKLIHTKVGMGYYLSDEGA